MLPQTPMCKNLLGTSYLRYLGHVRLGGDPGAGTQAWEHLSVLWEALAEMNWREGRHSIFAQPLWPHILHFFISDINVLFFCLAFNTWPGQLSVLFHLLHAQTKSHHVLIFCFQGPSSIGTGHTHTCNISLRLMWITARSSTDHRRLHHTSRSSTSTPSPVRCYSHFTSSSFMHQISQMYLVQRPVTELHCFTSLIVVLVFV